MKHPALHLSLVAVFMLSVLGAPAQASDWVEDDDLTGFYNHQVNKNTNQIEPLRPAPNRAKPPQYRTLGSGQSQGSVFDTRQSGGLTPGQSGFESQNQGLDAATAGLYSPLTVPPAGFLPNEGGKQKKKGFFGKLGSIGKSIAGFPAEAVEGAGAALSSPLFWQSAGALAGAGANAYMNYRFMRNNPGFYNPYYGYGGLGGYGNYGAFDPYFGGGYPGFGYNGLYGNRFANPYYGNGIRYGGLGLGGLRYGGGLYGGNLYGNPYFGNSIYRNPALAPRGTALNSINRFAPRTPASNFVQQQYNNAVNNSSLSNYDKYWLRQNPNPSLFGF